MATQTQFDLVLHDALVLGQSQCDTIAIANGVIAACGRFAQLSTMVGPRTHLIPLGGRAVAPGFIDSHLHFLEAASVAAGPRLWRVRSIEELLMELRQMAARTPPGNWVRAFGCDEALLRERRGPSRAELDQVTARNPLRLRHQTMHASWLNSRAIKMLGLEDKGFVPPSGARLTRDREGRLESLVAGMEEWLSERLPKATQADLQARARIFSRELAAAGITAFTDATVRNDLDQINLFARLAESGAVSQRTAVMLGEDCVEQFRDAADVCRQAGLGMAGVKFRGHPSSSPQLMARVRRALEAGARCAFHATEIEEIETALDATESALAHLERRPAAPLRIEHGGVIAPEQIPRLAGLKAWVVTNPGFIYYRGAKYAEEPGLFPYLYRCRSLARGGVRLAAGTDAPVTPAKPLIAIAAALARVNFEGQQLATQESIGIPQGFGLFTTAGAHLAGLAAGALEPGSLADLIVLPHDPLTLTPLDLASMQVDLTIIGGKVVYERGRPETVTGIPGF